MRIAFASCIATAVFPRQPVWAWIQAAAPDFLVLLGDSIYLDVPITTVHPSTMSDQEFAEHLHRQYSQLIQQPDLSALAGALCWVRRSESNFKPSSKHLLQPVFICSQAARPLPATSGTT